MRALSEAPMEIHLHPVVEREADALSDQRGRARDTLSPVPYTTEELDHAHRTIERIARHEHVHVAERPNRRIVVEEVCGRRALEHPSIDVRLSQRLLHLERGPLEHDHLGHLGTDMGVDHRATRRVDGDASAVCRSHDPPRALALDLLGERDPLLARGGPGLVWIVGTQPGASNDADPDRLWCGEDARRSTEDPRHTALRHPLPRRRHEWHPTDPIGPPRPRTFSPRPDGRVATDTISLVRRMSDGGGEGAAIGDRTAHGAE